KRELLESIPIGAAAGLLGLGAIAAVRLGPLGVHALLGGGPLAGMISFLVCWTVGATLLFALVAVVVRFAPAIERPLRWLSFGAAIIVVASAAMSILFGLYISTFASYASVFGSLATVFILIEYVFLLAVIFLGGIVVDSLLDGRERHD
nr:YihY/virulence factor BrkB family protein [Solirubrobacterales bacterium]